MSHRPGVQDESVTIYNGDCLAVLAGLPDNSVDSVVTDPPYGLEFMGKDWDAPWRDERTDKRGVVNPDEWGAAHYGGDPVAVGRSFQRWCEMWAAECLRVLKPGGHLLAFGGTRTWHRLASAVEDAGFEIRDSLAWLYGQGFPKSMNVSKAIDKSAGAVREQVGVEHDGARNGNGQNVDYGSFGSAADGTYALTAPATDDAKQWDGWGTALKPAFEPIVMGRKPFTGTVAKNVLEHGTGALNIDGCRVGTEERSTTRSSGVVVSQNASMSGPNYGRIPGGPTVVGRWPSNVAIDESTAVEIDRHSGVSVSRNRTGKRTGKASGIYGEFAGQSSVAKSHDDTGGASRFFPIFRYQAKAPKSERPIVDGVAHPTVKPIELMRWLVRMVTPEGGIVLDPFAGSGTTVEACLLEGVKCIAIERERDYLPLILSRIDRR